MLPISVLVPTRNSMTLLPKHLEAMRAWADEVEEIVAVDSHSTDGTLELLQSGLKHPNVRVQTHPPGLYQSWNFGIAQCRARYLYISTVGETITRDGLAELFRAVERFQADAVISPPRMVKVTGEPKVKIWPVHTLIETARLRSPALLNPAAVQLFAVANLLRGILGSSASNLYRTDLLQRFPFRTDFGTAGDLAWGLEHARDIHLAVVPESFSTFVFHPKSYAKSDYEVGDFNDKCLALAQSVASQHGGSTRIDELFAAWSRLFAAKRQFNAARCSAFWWLSRPAWQAKAERDSAERALEALQHDAMLELTKLVTHDSSPR